MRPAMRPVMRPAPSLPRLLGPALAAVLTISGLALGAAAPPARAADPLAGAPVVGTCFDVTIRQAMRASLTQAPVPCTDDHTLVTTAVVPLAPGVDLADEDALQKAAGRGCVPARAKLIGSSVLRHALTLYMDVFFVPSAAQQKAGAHWISCHLSVADTKGLNDLPAKLPRLAKKPAASVALCATERTYVTCAEKHRYRAVVALFVKAKGSNKAVARRMDVQGPKICNRRAGRSGFYDYYRHTPTRVVLTCFKKTRK